MEEDRYSKEITKFAHTNLGFALFSYLYIRMYNEEKMSFSFRDIVIGTTYVMTEIKSSGGKQSTEARRKEIVRRTIDYYEGIKLQKEVKEVLEKGYDEEDTAIAKRVVEEFTTYNQITAFLDYVMPQANAYLVSRSRRSEDRVFQDADVDFFYQELKKHFPDFYSAFEAMGISERDIENPTNPSSKYFPAYSKAKEMVNMKIEAFSVKRALEGDNSAINTYIKMNDKRRKDGEMVAETKETTNIRDIIEIEAPVGTRPRKDYAINIERPKDSPMYDPEKGIEEGEEMEMWIDPEKKEVEKKQIGGQTHWKPVKVSEHIMEKVKRDREAIREKKRKYKYPRKGKVVIVNDFDIDLQPSAVGVQF